MIKNLNHYLIKSIGSSSIRIILLAAMLPVSSLACTHSLTNGQVQSKEMKDLSSKSGESNMAFTFEDHATAESARKQLSELFPPGTENSQLVELMEKAGLGCHSQEIGVLCHNFFITPDQSEVHEWMVTTEGENNKISEIIVQYADRLKKVKKPEKVRGFRFEDHDTAASALPELIKLFPKGSQAEDFLEFMRELKTECIGPRKSKEGNIFITCTYTIPSSFLSGVRWSIDAELEGAEDRRINNINAYLHDASV